MKLVDNARGCWAHYSTQGLMVSATLQGLWIAFPDDLRAQLPHGAAKAVAYAVMISAVYGLIGKFVDQTPKDAP